MTHWQNDQMTQFTLAYPVLCLTRRMGVCVIEAASGLERCRAVVFWRGRFFDGLRVVDSRGETYEVVRASIRRPSSTLGRTLARWLDLSISVDVELKPAAAVSLAELQQIVEHAVDEDPEAFEEFSGKTVEWWKQALASCDSVQALITTLRA